MTSGQQRPGAASVPLPRDLGRPYRVCLVCMGNICRSPMAESVLRAEVERAGLGGLVEVDSAGVGDWHEGERMDPRASSELARRGYLSREHRARQIGPSWFAHRDLVLAMDRQNLRALLRMAGGRPDPGRPDPGRPDAGRPDAVRPDAGRPDPGRPDPGRPDPGRSDPGRPDPGRPDPGDRIRLLRSFDPGSPDGAEVPDPYLGKAESFAHVLVLIEAAAKELAARLAETLTPRHADRNRRAP